MNPAARVPPTVRLIFACDSVAGDGAGNIVVQNPRTHLRLPAGATFPFQVPRLSVYFQLVEGLGSFDVAVEMWRLVDDGTRRYVGTSPLIRSIGFTGPTRMIPQPRVEVLAPARFRAPGMYELRVVEVTADGSTPLGGMKAILRVMA